MEATEIPPHHCHCRFCPWMTTKPRNALLKADGGQRRARAKASRRAFGGRVKTPSPQPVVALSAELRRPYSELIPPEPLFRDAHSGAKRLTRWRRSVTGVSLADPFRYDDCLLCTKGFYRETQLREHYVRVHELDFGTAPLPREILALESFRNQRVIAPPASCYRCNLCGEACEGGAVALQRHKMTKHVNPKFMRYSCKDCQQRFLLVSLLQEHKCPKKEEEEEDDEDEDGQEEKEEEIKDRCQG